MQRLYDTEFTYTVPRDSNRFDDGINLRYRFGYERFIDEETIAVYLDNRTCSILEMMIALCVRCEEQIMSNSDVGDRTRKWFEDMISSLGLDSVEDSDVDAIDYILQRFLNREYESDGRGGLFTMRNLRRDLRSAEIWYQAMWYLDDILQSSTVPTTY